MRNEIGILITTYHAKPDDFKISTYLLNQLNVPVVVAFNGLTVEEVLQNCKCRISGLVGCYTDLGLLGDCINSCMGLSVCQAIGFKYTLKILGDVYVFSMDIINDMAVRLSRENKKWVSGQWGGSETVACDVALFETNYGAKIYNRALAIREKYGTECGLYLNIDKELYIQEPLKTLNVRILHSHTFDEKRNWLYGAGYSFLDNVTEKDFNTGVVKI